MGQRKKTKDDWYFFVRLGILQNFDGAPRLDINNFINSVSKQRPPKWQTQLCRSKTSSDEAGPDM